MGKNKLIGQAVQHALCSLRAEKGLSQEALGQRSDVSRQFISYLERQERSLSLESMIKLSQGLGIPLAEFAGRIEKMLIHYQEKRPIPENMAADPLKPKWPLNKID